MRLHERWVLRMVALQRFLEVFSYENRKKRSLTRFLKQYYTYSLSLKNSPLGCWRKKWFAEVVGDRVLDVGCGPILFDDVTEFGRMPKEIVGIDVNEAVIEFLHSNTHPLIIKSKEVLKAHGVGVDFFTHDVRLMEDSLVGRFDIVFASGVMGIFTAEEAKKVFKHLSAYLVTGGTCVVMSYTDAYQSKYFFAKLKNFQWCSSTDTGQAGIVEALHEAGFEVFKTDTFTIPNPQQVGWRSMYAVVAKK